MSDYYFTRVSRAVFVRAVILIAVAVAPFIFIVAMNQWLEPSSVDHSILQVRRVQAIDSSASVPEDLPTNGWQWLSLSNKTKNTGIQTNISWYRFDFDASAGGEEKRLTVLLSRPVGRYEAYINDHFVMDTESLHAAVHVRLLPVSVEIPAAFIRPDHNVIQLHCISTSPCRLTELEIGASRAVASKFRSAVLFEVTIRQITMVCMLTMSLIMAALFRARSQDSMFGWYALALPFWAAHIWLDMAPLSQFGNLYLRECYLAIALQAYLTCVVFFINRFIGVVARKIERWLIVWAVSGAIVPLVAVLINNQSMLWFYEYVIFPPLILLSAYQNWQLLRVGWKPANTEALLLAAVAWFLLVVSLRDDAVQVGVLTGHRYYYSYTVGLLLLALGFILLRHFIAAVNYAERARDELAVRIVDKTTELERNLLRLKDMQHEQALSIERERIMRDMHDGVGGQLVQALSIALSRPELRPLEEPLRACLEELRLIIDSIEPTNGDLASVLGTLRARMSRRLTAAGVQVHWQIEEIPVLTDFGPQRVFHVTHIVREAIANALKHSNARNITLRAWNAPHQDLSTSAVSIEITDDGTGMAVVANDGRGLGNMRRRAQDLGAQLSIESRPTGTKVRLDLLVAMSSCNEGEEIYAPSAGS